MLGLFFMIMSIGLNSNLWRRVVGVLFLGLQVQATLFAADASKLAPGLQVEFESAGKKDQTVLPGLSLFVTSGAPVTAFLPAGPFTATWTGFLSVDLRSDYFFQGEVSGRVTMAINGVEILSGEGTGIPVSSAKAIRLSKGTNAVKVTLQSPSTGDTFLRLSWSEKPFLAQPVPASVLSHQPTSASQDASRLRHGRELALELRCVKCHNLDGSGPRIAELEMDAPSLEGLGSRRQFDWVRRWIENPAAMRPTAHMPKVFHGAEAPAKARAVAAYLASQKETKSSPLSDPTPWKSLTPPPAAEATPAEAKPMFEKFHCAACHLAPDSKETSPEKLQLAKIGEKFTSESLPQFLMKPEAHYRWIRMPNFRLTQAEASALATELLRQTAKVDAIEAPDEPSLLAEGKRLLTESGCLQCHGTPPSSTPAIKAWNKLTSESLDRGCLATESEKRGRAPEYAMTQEDREALRAWIGTGSDSLRRSDPVEIALRYTRVLKCSQCHGQFEGFPAFEVLGAKLKPEWSEAFIAGLVPYKPRAERHPKGEPWLDARMPAFPAYASLIAPALSQLHGYAPRSTPEPKAVDDALAQIGRKLLGKTGGFSCVSCHGINGQAALEVFESEGINLAHTAERIRKPYFHRWMRLPMAVDPQTKMPAYFDEDGKSPLAEVLEGDAAKQLDAIWEYLRMGQGMVPPSSVDGAP